MNTTTKTIAQSALLRPSLIGKRVVCIVGSRIVLEGTLTRITNDGWAGIREAGTNRDEEVRADLVYADAMGDDEDSAYLLAPID